MFAEVFFERSTSKCLTNTTRALGIEGAVEVILDQLAIGFDRV